MSRITVCPQCQTRFRVTAEQLQARKGDVRCGRCNHIFDARKTLLDEVPAAEFTEKIETPQQQSMAEETPAAPPAEESKHEVEAKSAATEKEPPLTPEPALQEAGIAAKAEEITQPEAPPEPEPGPEVRVVRIQPPVEKEQAKVSPERPKYGPPPKPKRSWPWALASLLLALGLAGQGIYFFRDAIAANHPLLRPALEETCLHLQCTISLLQNPDLLSIESSELNADPARANIVILTSALRNRATHIQAYPVLELTLTNAKDEMVARRLFLPREYVRQASSITQGIPAKGEVAIKLLMDLGDLKAEGYRLYLFYPS